MRARRADGRVALAAALAICMSVLAIIAIAGNATAQAPSGYRWQVPSWAPTPVAPPDNPMTDAKVELGRHLFHDTRLSRDRTMACATCHQQARAFTDGLAAPVGVTGERHVRGSMPLANVGYLPVLTWFNPNLESLEQQALVPIFGEHPVEMGMAGREGELFARLRSEARYPPMFAAAFPDRGGEISLATITRALAAFQRALVSLDSPYDRYKYGGEENAISAAAKRGEALFFSEKFECYHCHAGFTFTDNVMHSRMAFPETGFHNNGLYNLDGFGAYPEANQGLGEFTKRPEDVGKFRTPTLRNIALTAPYMHDGSLATLREVLTQHYAPGGRSTKRGGEQGKGADNQYKSNFIVGFTLEGTELEDMVAFLESLTDERFVTDPRFADPFAAR